MICLFVCLFIWTMIVSSMYIVCWDLRTLRIKCFNRVLILFPALLSHIWINMFHISDNTSSYVTRSLGCHLTSRKPLRLVVPSPKFLLRPAELVLSIRSGRLHLAFATGPDPTPAQSKPGTKWWKTRGRASAGSIRCTQPGSPAAVAGGQPQEPAQVPAPWKNEAGPEVLHAGCGCRVWTRGTRWCLEVWWCQEPQSPKEGVTNLAQGTSRSGLPKRSQLFSLSLRMQRGKQGRVFQPCLWLQLF